MVRNVLHVLFAGRHPTTVHCGHVLQQTAAPLAVTAASHVASSSASCALASCHHDAHVAHVFVFVVVAVVVVVIVAVIVAMPWFGSNAAAEC